VPGVRNRFTFSISYRQGRDHITPFRWGPKITRVRTRKLRDKVFASCTEWLRWRFYFAGGTNGVCLVCRFARRVQMGLRFVFLKDRRTRSVFWRFLAVRRFGGMCSNKSVPVEIRRFYATNIAARQRAYITYEVRASSTTARYLLGRIRAEYAPFTPNRMVSRALGRVRTAGRWYYCIFETTRPRSIVCADLR